VLILLFFINLLTASTSNYLLEGGFNYARTLTGTTTDSSTYNSYGFSGAVKNKVLFNQTSKWFVSPGFDFNYNYARRSFYKPTASNRTDGTVSEKLGFTSLDFVFDLGRKFGTDFEFGMDFGMGLCWFYYYGLTGLNLSTVYNNRDLSQVFSAGLFAGYILNSKSEVKIGIGLKTVNNAVPFNTNFTVLKLSYQYYL
jgi:hypothetical protein